jgi:hypothetical protein
MAYLLLMWICGLQTDFEKSILFGIPHHHPPYHQRCRPRMGKLKFLQPPSITIQGRFPRVIPVLPGIRSIHTMSTNPPQIPLRMIKTKHHITLTRINHKSILMAKGVISRVSHLAIRKATMGSHNTSSKGLVIRAGHLPRATIKQVDIKTHQIIMSIIILGARYMPFLQTRQGPESKC